MTNYYLLYWFSDATRNIIWTCLVLFLSLIPISVSVVMVYREMFLMFNKEYPLIVLLWFYIGGPVCSCTSCYMPIFVSGDLITSYLINYMSGHFKTWNSVFQENTRQSYRFSTESQELLEFHNRYFFHVYFLNNYM